MPRGPKRRLAVARLWHEGNSFAARATTQEDFVAREWHEGSAATEIYGGSATEMGAVVAFAQSHPDWEITFLRCAAAPPGGPVDEAFLLPLLGEIEQKLAASSWDGVYLSLHGAMIGSKSLTPELDLLVRVREAIGAAPLAVTFDLHANLDPQMAALVDFVVGYKTYPHVDMDESAAKALGCLTRWVDGGPRPFVTIAKLGAVLPSFNMRSDSGPMAEVQKAAVKLACRPGILDVSPFGGFAYADTPAAGAGVAVTATELPLAEEVATELLAFFRARRAEFFVTLPDAASALKQALALSRDEVRKGVVVVLEPADNPLSGGGGDTPGLFRALLACEPPGGSVFAFFHDPDLVARARAVGLGGTIECQLGGRLGARYGAGVEAKAKVLRLTGGRFVNEGPMERGLAVDLGPTVVLGVQNVEVIVTSRCLSPNDPAYFELHGIDLDRVPLLCVKAKNHFRAAFKRRSAALIEADTPGPATVDISQLPFKHVPREFLTPGKIDEEGVA